MRLDGNEARAARAAARAEPIEYALGERVFTFAPEIPLDVLLGMEDAALVSRLELCLWLAAHTLADPKCDTSCVEAEDKGRGCPGVVALRGELRGLRVDGERLTEADVFDMWSQVRDAHAVTQGESKSSPGSSGTGGDDSKPTASPSPESTSPDSGGQGAEEPAGST